MGREGGGGGGGVGTGGGLPHHPPPAPAGGAEAAAGWAGMVVTAALLSCGAAAGLAPDHTELGADLARALLLTGNTLAARQQAELVLQKVTYQHCVLISHYNQLTSSFVNCLLHCPIEPPPKVPTHAGLLGTKAGALYELCEFEYAMVCYARAGRANNKCRQAVDGLTKCRKTITSSLNKMKNQKQFLLNLHQLKKEPGGDVARKEEIKEEKLQLKTSKNNSQGPLGRIRGEKRFLAEMLNLISMSDVKSASPIRYFSLLNNIFKPFGWNFRVKLEEEISEALQFVKQREKFWENIE